MFILCSGKMAENPYSIPHMGTKLYSLEELCYYIYHNVYHITEEFFTQELIVWIRDEIGHSMLAKKCGEMLAADSPDLKDLVVTILCASDYYKEEEIRKTVEIIRDVVNLPYYSRIKIKADNYLKYGKYGKATILYKELLGGSLAINFTTEEYGNILHNLGISSFHISSFRDSANYFKEAYIRNHRRESAKHYLYVLLIEEEEELFRSEYMAMGFSDEECKEIKREFDLVKAAGKVNEADEDFVAKCKYKLRKAFAV